MGYGVFRIKESEFRNLGFGIPDSSYRVKDNQKSLIRFFGGDAIEKTISLFCVFITHEIYYKMGPYAQYKL